MGAMGIVVLAVSVMIGLYLIWSIYGSVNGSAGLPAAVTLALNTTVNQGNVGMTLMAVAIIVGAAMFILSMMGGR
jgi:hypothetical protein